jgi:epoxyqueuosine reductase
MDGLDPREEIRELALGAGFDRVGFARAGPAPHADRFRDWVSRGYAGTMDYLARTAERRSDPREVLEGARSVLVLALHYGGGAESDRSSRSGGEARDLAESGRGEIARYARGTDYHRLMESRLKKLCGKLVEIAPAHRFRYYVDTGPVLERSWAEAAGVGWIGKNGCAIDPIRGSYFFISVILTTLELSSDAPAGDHCGTCRLCIDACPTAAIVEPRVIDARRCISYLNIEHRGPIPEEHRPAMGGIIFGCDICQEVCPFNRSDRLGGDQGLDPRPENIAPALAELAQLSPEGFAARFPRSAVRRAKWTGFLRNVLIAIGNGRRPDHRDLLDRLGEREDIAGDPILIEALSWARKRVRGD